jgi:hypothetical protein
MCLRINLEQTDLMKQKTGKIKAYKVYKVEKLENTYALLSPIKQQKVDKPGIVQSNRDTKYFNPNKFYGDLFIYQGIHVFLNKESAYDFRCNENDYCYKILV